MNADGATLVIFARHGETALNASGRFRGRADPELTEQGTRQAAALARAVERLAPEVAYASPRARARSTAAALAVASIEIAPALDDLDYGAWTGKTHDEVRSAWPDLYAKWLEDPLDVTVPNGEAIRQLVERVSTFLHRTAETHPGRTVIAVTHDLVIRTAVCTVLQAPLVSIHRVHIDLASTTGVAASRLDEVLWVNATEHLIPSTVSAG